jgi:hypothetical protein
MRDSTHRWFTELLKHPESTAFFAHKIFPDATIKLWKNELPSGKMVRHFEMYVNHSLILKGRSEVDMNTSNPVLVKKLRSTNQPLGILVKDFRVRRTRVRATSRTREYHFIGDLHAKVWERFFVYRPKKK